MLDEQINKNPDFRNFINPRFVAIRFENNDNGGKELWGKYNVSIISTPTVIIIEPYGDEIDRIAGFYKPYTDFLTKLKRYHDGRESKLYLENEIRTNPGNLKAALLLANKFRYKYHNDKKRVLLYKRILENANKTRHISAIDELYEKSMTLFDQAFFYYGIHDKEYLKKIYKKFPDLNFYEDMERVLGRYINYEVMKNYIRSNMKVMPDLIDKTGNIYLIKYVKFLISFDLSIDETFYIINEIYKENNTIGIFGAQFLADVHFQNDEYEQAITIYGQDHIRKYWDSPETLNSYAKWWVKRGENLDHAITVSKRSLELNYSYQYFYTLATCYRKMGDLVNALEYLEKTLEANPGYKDAMADIDNIKKEMRKKGKQSSNYYFGN